MASISNEKSQGSSFMWDQQQPFLQDLMQQGQQQFQGFQPNQQVAGGAMEAWQQQLNPQANPYLNDMTQQFRDQLGQANQQAGGQAGLTGGYGGGRHGVANSLNQQNYASQVGNFLGQQTQMGLQQQGNAISQGAGVLGLQGYGQQNQALNNYQGQVGAPVTLDQDSSKGSKFGVLSK
jgi:hypothetical protein